MGWSEEVHSSQLSKSLSKARHERAVVRKGGRVIVKRDAGLVPFALLVGTGASLVACRLYEKELKALQWRRWPIVRQFIELIRGKPVGQRLGGKPRSSSPQQTATGKVVQKGAAATPSSSKSKDKAPKPAAAAKQPAASAAAPLQPAPKPTASTPATPAPTLPAQPGPTPATKASEPTPTSSAPAAPRTPAATPAQSADATTAPTKGDSPKAEVVVEHLRTPSQRRAELASATATFPDAKAAAELTARRASLNSSNAAAAAAAAAAANSTPAP